MKKYVVTVNGISYEVEVEEMTDGTHVVEKIEPQRNQESQIETRKVVEKTEISAPMPGNILKVLVKVGEKVNSGDTLMILEALKMENEILAPSNGEVSSINVKEGQAVDTGELLVVLA